ncbi:MazG family protein [Cellulomonas sp. 179-A 9B4 NHS]|uniref:MazG family protein n=1 Tax=Cellulomonas sp. 179-A 9B4 NHS TaxID=3142379 RepID=UPI0039A34C71
MTTEPRGRRRGRHTTGVDAAAPALPDDVPAAAAPAAAAFGRLVAVMDRLRSPGGCPWDAEQTHTSLVPYALEEVHELAEAVDAGDREGLREELGDVLLQVVFHARVAQDDATDPFDVAEVADRLVAKLVRRHPHVFGDDADALEAGDVHRRWDDAKRAEKPARESALDGVPASLGALARTQKVAGKAVRAGLLDATAAAPAPDVPRAAAGAAGPADGEIRTDGPVPAPEDRDDVDAAVAVVTGPPAGEVPPGGPDGDAPPGADRGVPPGGVDPDGTPGGVDADVPPGDADRHVPSDVDASLGARLLALVLEAERDGVDAEGALRRAAAAWEVGLRAAERRDAPTPWR